MLKKDLLEKLYKKYNHPKYISPDPLQFARNYANKEDIEIVCLIASSLAYGNVKQIIKAVNNILQVLGDFPKEFLQKNSKENLFILCKNFKYRFTTDEQIATFLFSIKEIIAKFGSLENCFLSFYLPKKDYLFALQNFAKTLRSYGNISTLIPDPTKNSALKRLNLFMRWCVRKDNVDLGCWSKISCDNLLIPLDVHIFRVSKSLGLTKRNQSDIKTALEISKNLAQINPKDPIKYDFCLTRFGIHPDMNEQELIKMIENL